MFKQGLKYFETLVRMKITFVQKSQLILLPMFLVGMSLSASVSAATALPLEDQGGGVFKLLSNQNKYQLVFGFASIEGSREHLGYLALEQQGNWSQLDSEQNSSEMEGYSITRLGFKGEAFEYKHLHRSNIHSGAKFDMYLGDTKITPDYHWQALGIGIGYIFTPINQLSGLQITTGINTEPGFFRINGKSFDEYQLQPYAEMEYFIFPNFALMAKFDAIFSGDLNQVEQKVSDYWMGLRLFF